MTAALPGRQASQAASVKTAGGPATIVLAREVMPGHEQAFEAILRQLAAEARVFPGHLGLTVLRPQTSGQATYTIVAHFATGQDMEAWLPIWSPQEVLDVSLRTESVCSRAARVGRANCCGSTAQRIARLPADLTDEALFTSANVKPLVTAGLRLTDARVAIPRRVQSPAERLPHDA